MVKGAGLETCHILRAFSDARNGRESFAPHEDDVRHRRRRSAFAKTHPQRRYLLIGAAAVIVVGALFYFMHQADVLAPQPHEMRIDLPDAFKG